jgi:pimeloyl-ACP methyl ester carboxylesterase
MMKFVQSNGIQLAYEERGEGDPLVLIMGLGADGQVWDLHAQEYAKRFRCFLVDNRGTGQSDKPKGPYSTAQMADDYAGLIKSLGLGKVRVAGISMGGAIAQQLALRHPDLVRSLVLVCTWAKCDEYARAIFKHFAKARAALKPADFVQLLQLWIWTPAYMQANAADLVQAQVASAAAASTGSDSAWMPLHAFEAQCDACIEHDTTSLVHKINVPTLLTVGTHDIFTPMRFSEALHERIAGSKLKVFSGGGHVHHWEALEEFNQATTQWLLEN